MLSAGFPKPAMFYLAWVSLVPLLYAVHGKTGKQAFALGYICGLVHSCTCLFWIYHAVSHYGGFATAVSVLILLLLCCIMAVYPALFAFLAQKCAFRPLLYVFGLPCAWVALEWARAFAISGFPWANLGYTQTPLNPLIQIADITGVYGLSWLVVLWQYDRLRFYPQLLPQVGRRGPCRLHRLRSALWLLALPAGQGLAKPDCCAKCGGYPGKYRPE